MGGPYDKGFQVKLAVGVVLLVSSAVPLVQTVREFAFWYGPNYDRYVEIPLRGLPIKFADHRLEVLDSSPRSSVRSYAEVAGATKVLLDGNELLVWRPAMVRPGLKGLGRYHGWIKATLVVDRASGDSSVYFGRRLKFSAEEPRSYDLVVLRQDGSFAVRRLDHGDRGESYPVYRVVQFLNPSAPTVYRFSLTRVLELGMYILPLLLIVPIGYPLLSFLVGVFMLVRATSVRRRALKDRVISVA